MDKRKKEPPIQITARVRRFIKSHNYKKLQIYVTDELKNQFDSLLGLSEATNTEKLKALIDFWNENAGLQNRLLKENIEKPKKTTKPHIQDLTNGNIAFNAERTFDKDDDETTQPKNIY